MRKITLISLALIACQICLSQGTAWEPANKQELIASYQKTWNWFTNTLNYSFRLSYTSYKDHVSKEVIETSEGYYKRLGNKYKTEAVGIKTIQNEKMKLMIDTSDKMIAVLTPGILNPAMTEIKDLEALLDHVKSLKKKKTAKGICYRIDFNKNELYDAYEFTVSDKGLLESLVYYYSEQKDEDDGDGAYEKPILTTLKPRLEILFFHYEYPVKIADSEFSDKGIVVNEKGKIYGTDKYKNFQIKDYRYQAKK